MKIGILSGGGDAPGTNAAIRAVVKKAKKQYGDQIIGIKDGWKGLINSDFTELTMKETIGILTHGGSILGFSRTNPFKIVNGEKKAISNYHQAKLDAIIAIGGDDTLGVAYKMSKLGLNCIGIPKTIDNDLTGTEYSFGFNTAVSVATEALDRLHSTAEAHHRVIILEVMGRYTGWIAVETGIAGGADAILIPEYPLSIRDVCKCIKNRRERNRNFSLVVVAEGAKPKGGKEIVYTKKVDDFGNVHLGGIGYWLGKEIEKVLDIETRVVILGHLQRGGIPTAFDRFLATRFGIAAIDFVHKNWFGKMVALQRNRIIGIDLEDVIGHRKKINRELYDIASVFFG